LPDHPDITFKLDKPEGVLTLWADSPYGRIIIYSDKFGDGGIFRDRTGRPIARVLPDGTLFIAPDWLPDRTSNEPNLCPDPELDRPGARPKDLDYQYYMAQRLNPDAPTPYGFGIALLNPTDGRYVVFDDCEQVTGAMIDYKGTGYQAMMEKKSDYPWKGVVERALRQAERQLGAARGREVRWYFAEKPVADFFREQFKNKLWNITVIWAPLP
jgi:hypothetical protein